MAGRLSKASVLAVAALLAVSAMAAGPASSYDRACTRETIGRTPAPLPLQATIDAIFDRVAAPPIETPEGDFTPMVVMVRVKDGKPVLACVDSKEAATRFLTAPVEKIGTTKMAEEK